MKIIEAVSVGLRLFGVVLFVLILRSAPEKYAMLSELGMQSVHYSQYIQMGVDVFSLLFSIFMIKFPGVISGWLVTRSDAPSSVMEENGQAIQIAGITIIGVFILTWAIPDLFFNALLLWELNTLNSSPSVYMSELKISEIVTVLEIMIGVYLMVGAKGLTRILNKMRS